MTNELNILLVDDSQFMAHCLSKIINNTFHNIIGYANNGQIAVESYKKYKPNLVFMDITMPVLDGISALKEIIEYDPNAYVVMCSSMGQEGFVKEAIKNGAKDFVVKPFTEIDIRARILKCFIYKNRNR